MPAHLPVRAIEQDGLDAIIESVHPVEAPSWDVQAQPIGPKYTVLEVTKMSRCEPSIQALSSRPRRLSLGSSSQSVQYIHLWAATGQHHLATPAINILPCDPNPDGHPRAPHGGLPALLTLSPHISFIHSSTQQIFVECLLSWAQFWRWRTQQRPRQPKPLLSYNQ